MKRFQGYILNSIKNVLCWLGFTIIESCELCGIEQPICWWADNDLYIKVTGDRATIFCPECFEELARLQGIKLMWKPEIE